jgi:hypothetical protein
MADLGALIANVTLVPLTKAYLMYINGKLVSLLYAEEDE